jgi:hypothetical protein
MTDLAVFIIMLASVFKLVAFSVSATVCCISQIQHHVAVAAVYA